MASTFPSRLQARLLIGGLAVLLVGAGCGGSTDIGFQGYDGGPDTGAGNHAGVGGSNSTGGSSNTGGTGAGGNGGTAGIGTGGAMMGGAGGMMTGGAGGMMTGGVGGAGGTGGVVCGGQVCTGTSIPGAGTADPCCTSNGKCGLTSTFLPGGQCVEKNQAGKPDSSCPPLNQGGITLKGCCRPDDKCGYLDTFLGLGCVDPSQFGAPGGGTTCNYNGGSGGTGGSAGSGGTGGSAGSGGTGGTSAAGVSCGSTTCTGGDECCAVDPGTGYCTGSSSQCSCSGAGCTTTDVQCDGPEDCPGQVCCGVFSFQQNRYTQLECRSSCSGYNLREICHPGQTCTDTNQTCSQSPGLPSGYDLYRCN